MCWYLKPSGLTSQLQEPWEPWAADMAAKPWRMEVCSRYLTLHAHVCVFAPRATDVCTFSCFSWPSFRSLSRCRWALTESLHTYMTYTSWQSLTFNSNVKYLWVVFFLFVFPGGHRALGLGGRAGGYGTPGAYGTSEISTEELLPCLLILCLLSPLFCFCRCRSRHGVRNWTYKRTGPGFGPGRETW